MSILRPVLTVLLGASAAAQAEPLICGSINLDTVVKDAKVSKAVKACLQAEFEPQVAELKTLTKEREAAERTHLMVQRIKQGKSNINEVMTTYDQMVEAREAEQAMLQALQKAMRQRSGEELNLLIQRVNDRYLALGRSKGHALLFHAGGREPAFAIDASARAQDCAEKVDLTAAVIEAVDRP